MQTNYFLIDYENVRPEDLSALRDEGFRVKIFMGASQRKIPFELADSLQPLGTAVDYIRISGNGHNALDFHIAYVMGQLAAQDKDAIFHIISGDAGYDPLIEFVNRSGIRCRRSKNITPFTSTGKTQTGSISDRLDLILKNLKARENGKPKTEKTLRNTIQSLFQKKLADAEIQHLILQLKKKRHIQIHQDGRVDYQRLTT